MRTANCPPRERARADRATPLGQPPTATAKNHTILPPSLVITHIKQDEQARRSLHRPTALRANHCEAADAVARKSQRASPPASLHPSLLTQHQHDEPLRPAPLADGDTRQPPPAALEASAHLPLAEPVQPAAKEVASAAAETQQRDAVDQAATAHALDEQMVPRVHARAEDIIQRLNQWCTQFVESYTRKIEKVVGEYQEAQVRRLQEALTAAQEYDQLHAWNTATKAKLHEHVVLLQRHIPGEQTSKDAVLTPVRMDALTPHALPADAMSARADPGALALTNADAEDPAQDDEVLGSEEGALSEASGPGPACASAADERRPDFSTPEHRQIGTMRRMEGRSLTCGSLKHSLHTNSTACYASPMTRGKDGDRDTSGPRRHGCGPADLG